MRTRSVLLITLVALIGATPASAAPPVLGPADGVQATRTDTTLVVTFAGDPATWTPLVGRERLATCQPAPDATGLQFVDDRPTLREGDCGGQRRSAADGAVKYTLLHQKAVRHLLLTGIDERGRAVVLGQVAPEPRAGRSGSTSRVRAEALRDVLDSRGKCPRLSPAGCARRGHRRRWTVLPARLARVRRATGPTALDTPPSSTLSAAGRHLVIEDLGDGMLRTNVLVQGEVLSLAVGVSHRRRPQADKGAPDGDKGPSPYQAKAVTRSRRRPRTLRRQALDGALHRALGSGHPQGRRAARRGQLCAVRPPRALFGVPRRSPAHAPWSPRATTWRHDEGDAPRAPATSAGSSTMGRVGGLGAGHHAGRRLVGRHPRPSTASHGSPTASRRPGGSGLPRAGPGRCRTQGRHRDGRAQMRHRQLAVSASGPTVLGVAAVAAQVGIRPPLVMADEGEGMLRTNVFADEAARLAAAGL